jgi:hypothetical protein
MDSAPLWEAFCARLVVFFMVICSLFFCSYGKREMSKFPPEQPFPVSRKLGNSSKKRAIMEK